VRGRPISERLRNEPNVPELDPKTFPVLLEKLGPAKCHAFLCRRCGWAEQIPAPRKKVFGKTDDHRALCIIANRSVDTHAWRNTLGLSEMYRTQKGGQDVPPPAFFDLVAIRRVFLGEWCRPLLQNDLVSHHRDWGSAGGCREDPTVYGNHIVYCQP